MLFVCDHYRFYELKDKVKSSAYLAASMIQIGNTKSDKQLTLRDMRQITYACGLNFLSVSSNMFKPWPFGVYVMLNCYWVKRINNDEYQYQHTYCFTQQGTEPHNMDCRVDNVSTIALSQVEALNPNLVCHKNGDERLLVGYYFRKAAGYNKRKLGFFILEPGNIKGSAAANSVFVHEIFISPKPGLFPVKNE